MRPDKDDLKYKNLFSRTEEVTDIPEFEDIINFPARQKNHSRKSVMFKSFMMVGFILLIGIYYFRSKTIGVIVSKNGDELVQNNRSLLWEWTSPTQQLLSASLTNTFTNFNTPTDFLSLKKISSQTNRNINTN